MIIPFILSVSREVLATIPQRQKEAVLSLGGTRWEMLRIVIGQHCLPGIFGAAILGLGRALGETMAVTMVIGNRPEALLSLFQPGYSMAAVIANEFTEAVGDVYLFLPGTHRAHPLRDDVGGEPRGQMDPHEDGRARLPGNMT